MPVFDSFDDQNNGNFNSGSVKQGYDFANKKAKGLFLTRVFGMMFVCLLITTVVAVVFGYGFQTYLLNGATIINDETILDPNAMTTLAVILGVSAIALIVMSFVLPITFARGKRNILIPLMIYAVLMGILLSAFTFIFDWYLLAEAFGLTTLVFGVMALLGYVSKGRLAGIGVILSSLIIGALIISLFNFVMFLSGAYNEGNFMLAMIASLMIFAFLMLVTLYDVNRIKKIAESGEKQDNNLVLFCAYILYSDFIALLVRIVYFLAIFTSRRR